MKIEKTKLDNVLIVKNKVAKDKRGTFCKTFHFDFFNDKDLTNKFKESYYSVSKRNVIRGMHFQLPPFDHDKLVYVPKGEILDVVLDIRRDSNTYGNYIQVILSEENIDSLYIPRGFAHGFKAIKDNTITVYNVSTVYNKKSDSGIRWDSFGMDWGVENPIISKKDEKLTEFVDFESPFYVEG